MADTDIAGQSKHVALLKYIPDESIAFPGFQPVLAPGHYSRGILATMLQDG